MNKLFFFVCFFVFLLAGTASFANPIGSASAGKCDGLLAQLKLLTQPHDVFVDSATVFIDMSVDHSIEDLAWIFAESEGKTLVFSFPQMKESEMAELIQSFHEFIEGDMHQTVVPKGGVYRRLGSELFFVPEIKEGPSGHIINFGNDLTFLITGNFEVGPSSVKRSSPK